MCSAGATIQDEWEWAPSVLSCVAHHVVGGAVVFPGVGYIEMAMSRATSDATSLGPDVALSGVAFLRLWELRQPGAKEAGLAMVRWTRTETKFEVASCAQADAPFLVHASGNEDRTKHRGTH